MTFLSCKGLERLVVGNSSIGAHYMTNLVFRGPQKLHFMEDDATNATINTNTSATLEQQLANTQTGSHAPDILSHHNKKSTL